MKLVVKEPVAFTRANTFLEHDPGLKKHRQGLWDLV
jgi:hypothetical protein